MRSAQEGTEAQRLAGAQCRGESGQTPYGMRRDLRGWRRHTRCLVWAAMRVSGLVLIVVGLALCWLFIGPQPAVAEDPNGPNGPVELAPPVRPRDGGSPLDATNPRPPQPLK